jgi:outer membrane protein TolC
MNIGNGGRRGIWIALIVLIFLVVYPVEIVISQENPVLIDFDEALKRAFTGDPGLIARNDQIRIDEYKATESVSRFNPRLDIYSAYSRTSLESEIELVNPLTSSPFYINLFPEDRYNFGISLSHNIITFGKRSSSRDAVRAKIEISKLEKEEYKRSLYDNVARVFLAALFTGNNLDIHKENMARAQRKFDIVISRMNEGLASDYDSIRAELLLTRYENDVAVTRSDFAEAGALLKALLNLNQGQQIMPVGDLKSFYVEIPGEDEIDINGNIEVLKLGKSIDVQNELIRFHKSSYLPNIGYFAKYDWQNGYQPDVDKLENFWTAGLSLNMNLFDGGGKKSRISQARYEARRAGNLRSDLISYIESEIKSSQTEISTTQTEINIAEKRVKLAERGLAIAEARYQEGLLSISDLLDLELEKADAEIGLNSAVYRLAGARLDLKSAAGYYPELEKR